jgi:hypothetical protein
MTMPGWTCPKCGRSETCRNHTDYPEKALRRMQKNHKAVCDGIPVYCAGIQARGPIVGQSLKG